MELTSIASLVLIITYTTDIIFGLKDLEVLSAFYLILVIIGSFIVSNGSIGFSKVKGFLFIILITGVSKGYLAHFAMGYTNATTYTFLTSLFTAIACLPFTRFFSPTKHSFKKAIPIQASGAVYITFMNLLSSIQVTLYTLVGPISMSITLIITYFTVKEK